ncbi:ribonuclease E inhibitor RraB [Paenibacillus sp. GCM10027629]|uniref:ribonuclease E inhibitor RraB n=1 Tax=Paenibacillus sp. GCM10027629 TaxID=3273414 RepID=UPI003630E7B1
MRQLSLLLIMILCLSGCTLDDNENNNYEMSSQADKDNLENLKKSGVDFNKEQLVDFQISVDSENNGIKINEKMANKGYKCTLQKDYEGDRWTSECSKEIILEFDTIVNIQEEINKISEPYNGFSDGWGMIVKP